MNEPLLIRYRFDLPDGSQKTLEFSFDPTTFKLQNPPPADPPFWTELKFNRCVNCPLNDQDHPHCPAAVQMAAALEPLKALVSFDTVGVTVLQPERKVYAETTVQQAMSSVFGLIMATSGCPWTDRLRPMARFHVPFAGDTETLYRSVSMYLLSREFVPREKRGAAAPGAAAPGADAGADAGRFSALEDLYRNLHVVNRDMSRRLGAAATTDPARNALALLDSFTLLLPVALEHSLDELQPLFSGWQTP
jgi:hypothetical protein